MIIPELMWVLLVVTIVLSAVGFYKFVYFLSVGYGLAVAGEGVAMAAMAFAQGRGSLAMVVLCALFVAYGIRLSGFLILREVKSAAYRKVLDSQTSNKVPVFVSAAVWICVAFLYVILVSPVFYRLANGGEINAWAWVGAAVMLGGIVLEAASDKQKSAAKKKNPKMVAMDGLFKLVRCPNYLGEIIFWTGVLLSGIGALQGWQWLVSAIGYVCIVYIMFNGAQRLEKRQNKSYGSDPAYRHYADTTPILIPFVPLYHLVKEEK